MAKRIPGQPGKLVSWLRKTLLGRPLEPWPWARSVTAVSPRSPPPPSLPGGPAHKLADNYYVTRDPRRDVAPPVILSSHKLLKESAEQLGSGDVMFPQLTTPPTPGTARYQWSEIPTRSYPQSQ